MHIAYIGPLGKTVETARGYIKLLCKHEVSLSWQLYVKQHDE